MKVKLKTTLANAKYSGQPGQIIDLPEEEANALIEGNFAERVHFPSTPRTPGPNAFKEDVIALVRDELEKALPDLHQATERISAFVRDEMERMKPLLLEQAKSLIGSGPKPKSIAELVRVEIAQLLPEISQKIQQEILANIKEAGQATSGAETPSENPTNNSPEAPEAPAGRTGSKK